VLVSRLKYRMFWIPITCSKIAWKSLCFGS